MALLLTEDSFEETFANAFYESATVVANDFTNFASDEAPNAAANR
ncbi:hypothetical protein [Carnimonas bestiolae]